MGDKMAEDVTNLKNGKTVDKPIYNHITGELDPDETVSPTPIVIFEGLHPMYDERVNVALDLTIYLDITDSVKFAWKAQRDIAERGATMEDVQKAIDDRKPDFAAYVEPQKQKADIIIQVLMSDLVDDPTGKILKVKYIQKKSVGVCERPFLFDQGSKIEWTPNGEKLSTKEGGVLFKSYDELTEQMVKNADAPGSENGTGLFQTLASFKIREASESITKSKYAARFTA